MLRPNGLVFSGAAVESGKAVEPLPRVKKGASLSAQRAVR
jgi:hypothetical protein